MYVLIILLSLLYYTYVCVCVRVALSRLGRRTEFQKSDKSSTDVTRPGGGGLYTQIILLLLLMIYILYKCVCVMYEYG